MQTFTTNSNIMIQEWEVFPAQTGGDPYEIQGLGTGTCDVTIENVFPSAVVPDNFVDVVDEKVTIDFEGFAISDPALMERTEEFWYRWDYGDGTPVGDWIYKGTIAPPPLNVLLLHSWGYYQNDIFNAVESQFAELGFEILTVDEYNFGPTGFFTISPLSKLLEYDVVVVSMDYYIFSTVLTNQLGDRLADYSDAGGGVVQMTFAAGSAYYSQVAGRWMAEDYNPIGYAGNHYGYVSLGDYNENHPIMEEVTDLNCYYKHGTSSVTSGANLVAEYSNGYVLCAETDLDHHAPGGGRIVGLNFFPWPSYAQGDAIRMMINSIIWAWGAEIPTEILDTVSHDYGDNGIYTAGLQIIDDDMMWQWGGPQPIFTGPGNEEDWISYTYFPVEVLNVDPMIHGIRAEMNLDLVIRTTGEPKNDCTMTLWEGTTMVGQVTVYHDGNYQYETLPATLDIGNINDYYVTVEYENADPDGANPTWVFEGRFPSGHTKELKNVFKEDGTIWTIDNDLFKGILLGEDMIFSAAGSDVGSDDLAFDWNFDDGGDGIHVYANHDGSMVEGASAPPEDVFNAHPDRDPYFIRPVNDERSPLLKPMRAVDEISHAFEERDYYYVTLLLMDDDVCDGYPSYQYYLNGGGYDMEFYEVDLS
jgi:hypothetical protein